MRCPDCGYSTRVIETRHPDHAARLSISSAAGKAQEAVGCYNDNWVARKRRCLNPACEKKLVTVEITLEALGRDFDRRG